MHNTAQKPRLEGAGVASKLADGSEQAQEGLLNHLLGETAVSRNQKRSADRPHLVGEDEELESARVALFEALNGLFFVQLSSQRRYSL